MTLIQLGKPAVVLAPMEGILEAPLRAAITEIGGFTYCVADFLRVSQDIPPLRTFFDHVPELNFGARTPTGTPIQVQLLGGDPDKLAETAARAIKAGSPGVDLNFGCPAPTVNRHDGGASLLRYPHRIREIVKAVRAAVPAAFPVSAKLRLGWDDPQSIHLNSEMAVEGGASWITIHGRTKMQGYIPPCYWTPIGEVKKRVGIPVVANGEIWSLEDFLRCRDETQCEHFMLGRGALANPLLASQISRELGLILESNKTATAPNEWSTLFRRFADLSTDFTDRPGYAIGRIKQWARMIHQKTPLPWLEKVKPLKDLDEILDYIQAAETQISNWATSGTLDRLQRTQVSVTPE